MALVVFVRGINVGGHRRLRPSVMARELARYGVVNVGAAGTFVVWRPGARGRFVAELRRRLPFEAVVASCESEELMRLVEGRPFGNEAAARDEARFVSVLAEAGRGEVALPVLMPEEGEWLVRVLGAQGRLVYGVYRRRMKTIGCLGRMDELFGAPMTTRGWGTVEAVARLLRGGAGGSNMVPPAAAGLGD